MSLNERDSAGLLQVLLDLMPETIYFKDTAGRFTHVSRSLAKFYGVDDPQKVIGKTDFDFYPNRRCPAVSAR